MRSEYTGDRWDGRSSLEHCDDVGAVEPATVGRARPSPWLLAVLLVVILLVLWVVSVRVFLRVDAWGDESAGN